MGRIVYPDWYVESIDMWVRMFILIGMWGRPLPGRTRSSNIINCRVAPVYVGRIVHPDHPLKVFLIVVWAGSLILINTLTVFLIVTWGKICDVEQVPRQDL